MNIILLSGGSGKRLWPLSNDVRSKQFIKLFKNNDEYESMVQRVYRQITTVEANAKITIATSKSQASAIKNQLGEKASICVEPCRRDTFPAIALAAAYLHDELGVAENEAVVVCPVDPCGGYFALIGYVLVQNLTISKEQIQKIFVNYTKLIVLFFFIQYAIFKISGNIIFIDFYNPQMRAGFLRAGVGSEFVALSIIIMFAEFLQTYRKKKRFDIKLIIWMGIFSVYFVLFICIRAAILAIFLSCLVLVFIGTDSRKLKLGILLLGVLGGALILQSSVFDKYMQIDKIEGGGSITGRLAMYAYYFNGFMQHPIMGQGFIKPINSALTTLLYGQYGFYYLEDVGIVGYLFTFGLVGLFLFLTFITKGMKTIISGYKDRSIFSDSVVLGVFMFLVFTMPTLFLFDYARNGFLMFVLLFMTPKSERN